MNTQSPQQVREFATMRPGNWSRFLARRFQKSLDWIDTGLETGALEVVLPDGTFRMLGGRKPGGFARVRLHSWWALIRLSHSGSIGWYQAWEKGEWSSPDPVSLFELFMRNRLSLGKTARSSGLPRVAKRIVHAFHRNSRQGARKNIIAHYDLGNDFYSAWLDRTMSYSSAIFAEPISASEDLETAQKRKAVILLDRLELRPSAHILEIGCGWGYFSRLCAENGHRVTAITLSPSQKLWAEQCIGKFAPQVDYRLEDYRDVSEQFDAITSIEMVEAVGQRYWPDYLDAIFRCLKPGGRAALQYIAIADDVFNAYASGVDFIQSYIFPGGMLLSESRFRALAEARGLQWKDAHHFPLHYAETLRRWRLQFEIAVESGTLPATFDRRFIDLWRYYLMYCEGGFRSGGITVAQVTLVKMGDKNESLDIHSNADERPSL